MFFGIVRKSVNRRTDAIRMNENIIMTTGRRVSVMFVGVWTTCMSPKHPDEQVDSEYYRS